MNERLQRQLDFIREADRLKRIERRNYLSCGSRRENSAEHSWFLAIMALALGEWANPPGVDLFKAVRLVLLHDLVEIDAGDTFLYDEAGQGDKPERERLAADRIFGLLPEDQGAELRALWEEFEAGQTPEARLGRSLDRLAALYLNFLSGGRMWREYGITAAQVRALNEQIELGSEVLWETARGLIDQAERRGFFPAEP